MSHFKDYIHKDTNTIVRAVEITDQNRESIVIFINSGKLVRELVKCHAFIRGDTLFIGGKKVVDTWGFVGDYIAYGNIPGEFHAINRSTFNLTFKPREEEAKPDLCEFVYHGC